MDSSYPDGGFMIGAYYDKSMFREDLTHIRSSDYDVVELRYEDKIVWKKKEMEKDNLKNKFIKF